MRQAPGAGGLARFWQGVAGWGEPYIEKGSHRLGYTCLSSRSLSKKPEIYSWKKLQKTTNLSSWPTAKNQQAEKRSSMFTLKFYTNDLALTRIFEAESLTILRFDGASEITLHQRVGDDFRIDVSSATPAEGCPRVFQKAIIENSNGKTTEIIQATPR